MLTNLKFVLKDQLPMKYVDLRKAEERALAFIWP